MPGNEGFGRVAAIFAKARHLVDAGERDAFIHAQTEDASELRELSRLLAADGSFSPFEFSPLVDAVQGAVEGTFAITRDEGPGLPESIGGFQIVRRIGVGGMGTVFEAEQARPRRRVALKLLRPDLVTDGSLRRFDAEARALAALKHPNIAQIYALGEFESPSGRLPYIVMELVRGTPLTHFANEAELSREQRIELLIKVCEVVQHTHQRGIVHRDLKPNNILVNADAEPKLLDFGVCRDASEERTKHTTTGNVLGTLSYMAPEQALGDTESIDTRSDVFALGVLGYELFAGTLPLQVENHPIYEAVRMIVEDVPPPLKSGGDLAIVLAKAMRKHKDARYSSPAALADDLRRILRREPIVARAPALHYHVGRFVLRNRALVAGLVLVVLGLAVGLFIALKAASREGLYAEMARRNAGLARRHAYIARIQAASALAQGDQLHAAHRRLGEVERQARGWEWRYLSGILENDSSHHRRAAKAGYRDGAVSHDGARVVALEAVRRAAVFHVTTGIWATLDFDSDATALAVTREGAVFSAHVDHTIRLDSRTLHRTDHLPVFLGLAPGDAAAVLITKREERRTNLHLIDARTGDVGWKVETKTDFQHAAFSPDGRWLAASTGRGWLYLFDTATGRSVWHGHIHDRRINTIAMHGKTMATASADRTIRVHEIETGRAIARLDGHVDSVHGIAFSPDGSTLASGHPGGVVRVWDYATERVLRVSPPLFDRPAPTTQVRSMRWRDDDTIVTLHADGVRVRSATQELVRPVLRGHRGRDQGNANPYLYDVDFDASGNRVATAGWDGSVRLWDVTTGRELASLEHPGRMVPHCRFAPDGRTLASYSRVGRGGPKLHLWDARTGASLTKVKLEKQATGLEYARDGSIVTGEGQFVRLYDPASLKRLREIEHGAKVSAVATSNRYLAVALESGDIVLYDANGRRALRTLRGHADKVTALAFTLDGARLASGGLEDGVLRLWNTGTGSALWEVDTGRPLIYSLAFTRDGQRIFMGSRARVIRVFDTRGGEELIQMAGHDAYVYSLAMSPDGSVLASASGDNTARLWHTRPVAARRSRHERLLALERELAREKLPEGDGPRGLRGVALANLRLRGD
ncbi:MAG: protein kinase domain-containing protein [Planctomycetota bacterium]|jgi:WD40 repeat protein